MCLLMKRRIKLEFFDRTGAKHSLAIEGDFTVEKVNRLLEYAEIVAGPNQHTASLEGGESKMNRLTDVINTQLADRSFDSREIWGEGFTLGAVSTYLSRLADRGMLERTGSAAHWFYRLKASPSVSP